MPSMLVSLRYSQHHSGIRLREVCGADELMVTDNSTACALELLNRLINGDPDNIMKAEQIVTADRDLLLGHIYRWLYGDMIASTVACKFCESKFDMDFSLAALQDYLYENRQKNGMTVTEDGTYQLNDACSFRLPTGEDELAVMGLDPPSAALQMLTRCVLEGDPEIYGEQVQEAMAATAPVVQTDMQAFCPGCGKEQFLFFDMQLFLLGRLINEQKRTIHEIHQLASAYHWNNIEIASLPRRLRRMYCQQIESDK